jgi:hypothetical protein
VNSRIGKGDMSTPKGDMKTQFGDMKTRFGDMSRRDILARARPPSGRDVTVSHVTAGVTSGVTSQELFGVTVTVTSLTDVTITFTRQDRDEGARPCC